MPTRQQTLFAQADTVEALIKADQRYKAEVSRQGKIIQDLIRENSRLKFERDELASWILK